MSNWRARVGIISPPVFNPGLEEFMTIAPEGVGFRQALLYLEDRDSVLSEQQRIDFMSTELGRAVRILDNCGVDIIGQSGAPFLFTKVSDFEQTLSSNFKKITNIPVVFMASSTVEALKKMGARTIDVATYYSEQFNSKYKEYLERNGLEVKSIRGLPETQSTKPPSHKFGEITEERVYRFSKSVYLDEGNADALLISGGGIKTLGVIQALEEDLHVTVVSSNIALFWKMFHTLHIAGSFDRFGSLLQSLAKKDPKSRSD